MHGLGQLVPYYPRPLAFGPLEERCKLALAVCLEGDGNVDGRVRHRPLGGMRADALAVGDRLHQRVATEPVGAVHGDAGRLARGVETVEHGAAPDVRVDAAHVVVGSRPDGNGLEDRVDTREGHRELARAVQALEDLLRPEMAKIEEDVAVDSPALVDLGLLRPGNDVARRELHRVRRVPDEKALGVLVQKVRALSPATLGDEDARGRERRGMELHHLHVLQRNPHPERHRHPVAGAGVRVGRTRVEPSGASCGDDDRLGADGLEAAVH